MPRPLGRSSAAARFYEDAGAQRRAEQHVGCTESCGAIFDAGPRGRRALLGDRFEAEIGEIAGEPSCVRVELPDLGEVPAAGTHRVEEAQMKGVQALQILAIRRKGAEISSPFDDGLKVVMNLGCRFAKKGVARASSRLRHRQT